MNRLYGIINDAARRPTPAVTIEAVLVAVRLRGLGALHEPATLERLSRCDDAARAQIEHSLAKLFAAQGAA